MCGLIPYPATDGQGSRVLCLWQYSKPGSKPAPSQPAGWMAETCPIPKVLNEQGRVTHVTLDSTFRLAWLLANKGPEMAFSAHPSDSIVTRKGKPLTG